MSDQLATREVIREIFVYRFLSNNRDAVDQYLKLVEKDVRDHIASAHAEKPMFYVMDVSQSGMFPLTYMRQAATKMIQAFDSYPKNYIAYVIDDPGDSVLFNMINAMTARELEHTRKVFQSDEMDKAIDWILAEKMKEYN